MKWEHPSREETDKVRKVFTHFKESVNESITSTDTLLWLCLRFCCFGDGVSLDQRSVKILPLFSKKHPCACSPGLRYLAHPCYSWEQPAVLINWFVACVCVCVRVCLGKRGDREFDR